MIICSWHLVDATSLLVLCLLSCCWYAIVEIKSLISCWHAVDLLTVCCWPVADLGTVTCWWFVAVLLLMCCWLVNDWLWIRWRLVDSLLTQLLILCRHIVDWWLLIMMMRCCCYWWWPGCCCCCRHCCPGGCHRHICYRVFSSYWYLTFYCCCQWRVVMLNTNYCQKCLQVCWEPGFGLFQ